ncbi:MAG: NAD-dependent epimerase/dehydratase family protein [Planctomycetia bacterium]|nr:NAD-dependent epimerase/dehydratase family protein [Planctomycetia bacterium]
MRDRAQPRRRSEFPPRKRKAGGPQRMSGETAGANPAHQHASGSCLIRITPHRRGLVAPPHSHRYVRDTPHHCGPRSMPSPSILVTGATGLLGSYLVRDLLARDVPLAVLARPSRKQSARDRVEALVAGWETCLGRPLPRPAVLEGDLTQEGCGLDADAVRWVGRHCGQVLNNAASLAFVGADRDGEPWRTNVGGIRNVLALAEAAGIRHVHHVSTAYVCGLRSGTVLERDLDCGQAFGNDYEASKAEAEQLLRSAAHLDSATVYRPSIIVGDSHTGYTSTYHGYFASLRLGHTLLTRVPIGSTSGQPGRARRDAPRDASAATVDGLRGRTRPGGGGELLRGGGGGRS